MKKLVDCGREANARRAQKRKLRRDVKRTDVGGLAMTGETATGLVEPPRSPGNANRCSSSLAPFRGDARAAFCIVRRQIRA
jgi:hypothetical protein